MWALQAESFHSGFLWQATKWCEGPSRQADCVEGQMSERTQQTHVASKLVGMEQRPS